METLWQDIRSGVRMLVKNPGFTTVAALNSESLLVGVVSQQLGRLDLAQCGLSESPNMITKFNEFCPAFLNQSDHFLLFLSVAPASPQGRNHENDQAKCVTHMRAFIELLSLLRVEQIILARLWVSILAKNCSKGNATAAMGSA